MKLRHILLGLVSWPVFAASNPAEFHREVIALHERVVSQQAVRTTEESGNYEGAAAARYRYVDTRYFDAASGQLLSRVRRDAVAPDLVHIVEVNIYENGKLARDFGSITLPWAPLKPTRTMINLHHDNGDLHSFRQYDFFGEVVYESCEGKLDGKQVRIGLDGSDINEKTTGTAAYKACFGGMSKDWAQYKTPH